MDDKIISCRHLAQFFEVSVLYNLNQLDFTKKALCSNYKKGIEIYQPQWYSQSKFYYFEEFLEENDIKKHIYDEIEIDYEKERMYWFGYCLQTWSNNLEITGEKILELLSDKGIIHLLENYRVYHTVDFMYVYEDTMDYLEIKIN